MTMDCTKLLSEVRHRPSMSHANTDKRNEFEKDYGRMVFSSVVRRLQGKSQVFPLDPNDFVRTRLTHSIEVATLGRSVGASIQQIFECYANGKIGPILATAGLIHDIGNPPFGHHGETAIREFFDEYFKKHPEIEEKLTDEQIKDFRHFDGNPQTFRLLTRLQWLWGDEGFNLTAATLATTIKYPVNSIDGNKGTHHNEVEKKKFGFFDSERSTFEKIWEQCGLEYGQRHPLAYVLEALDDIAYVAADIEDGVKKGLITLDDIAEEIDATFFEKAIKRNEYVIPPGLNDEKTDILVQRLRIYFQGEMITALLNNFQQNLDALKQGNFHGELLDTENLKWVHKLKELTKKRLFNDPSVLQMEVAGSRVIKGLLKTFADAVMDSSDNVKSTNSKILRLIPSRLRYVNQGDTTADRLRMIVDFVSGMTDNYAVKLYQQLIGVSL